ncbi:MAG TPA: aminotransferase class III-fold pyridoxal phosphate-dependent enzyme [Gaiellales bacterium]|nr:aminotransferase class III-fold pyridoxal phosphate-dependent enzyme [Gaiellales bacterium]
MDFVVPSVHSELPGPRSRALLTEQAAVVYGPMRDFDEMPVVLAGKSDWILEDVDGNTWADHQACWGSTPLGAHPPTVESAVAETQARYGMEITDYVTSVPAVDLARRIVEIAPPGLTRVAPSVSGTLAVESGVKFARAATGRPMILSFLGQYHGEATYLTAALGTDLAEVTTGSAPYVPGFAFAPYPNRFRAPFHVGPGPYDDTMYVDFIEDWLLVHQVEPEQIAGVLIEPIAGEGGILIPSDRFWQRLLALCERFGWLLILDEVQTGMGRCGPMFAAELWGLRPDLLLLGKGFAGGGQPLAAVLGTESVLADVDVHSGGTFAWVPAACAGALAAIDAIVQERVLDNVAGLAAIAEELLPPMVDEHEQVGDVRIAGAFIGIEFVTDRETIAPAPAFHRAVHHALLRRGVLGITQWGKWVYRMQPALNMPPELFRWSCEQVRDAVAEVARQPPEEPQILDRWKDENRRARG